MMMMINLYKCVRNLLSYRILWRFILGSQGTDWVLTPSSSEKAQCFGVTYRVHRQGRISSKARKKAKRASSWYILRQKVSWTFCLRGSYKVNYKVRISCPLLFLPSIESVSLLGASVLNVLQCRLPCCIIWQFVKRHVLRLQLVLLVFGVMIFWPRDAGRCFGPFQCLIIVTSTN